MDNETTTRGGSILIADDEDTFLRATADLLRDEGYQCDCAVDADSAVEKLRENRYDLMISDIKMPGNSKLELIHQLPSLAPGMPVILATGYPSMETATKAVGLPVVAYLCKPLDFDDALKKVAHWVKWSETNRAATEARQRLMNWCKELCDADDSDSDPAKDVLALSTENIAAALDDLSRLGSTPNATLDKEGEPSPNSWVQLHTMHRAITEAIEVLERTKGTFKSKQLGQLRLKLDSVISEWPV